MPGAPYGAVATFICLVLGYLLAYAIAFKSGRCKNLMLVLVIGPVIWSFVEPNLDVPWEWGWSYEALRYFIPVPLLYLVDRAHHFG